MPHALLGMLGKCTTGVVARKAEVVRDWGQLQPRAEPRLVHNKGGLQGQLQM